MTASIYIDGQRHLRGLDRAQREHVYRELSLPNHQRAAAERAGRNVKWMAETLPFWKHVGEEIVVPREYDSRWLNAQTITAETMGDPAEFTFRGILRPEQRIALYCLIAGGKHSDSGVLQAPTGAGKTVLALAYVQRRARKTIVLVHTKDLAEQWIDRTRSLLGVEPGQYGAGVRRDGDIVIATVQTAGKMPLDMANRFGLVIVDECHRVPATTYSDCLARFPAHFRLGLSATPYRRDQLDQLITWHIGPVLATLEKQDLIDEERLVRATVQPVYLGGATVADGQAEYSKMLSELVAQDYRTKKIADEVDRQVREGCGLQLVLTDRVSHAENLQREITKAICAKEEEVGLLHGRLQPRRREEIIDRARKGELRVLVATGQLIGEGFDLPEISVVHLATPIKWKGRLLQYIGRALRPSAGKERALIVDYVDHLVPVLAAAWQTRKSAYRKEPGIEVRG